MTAINFKSKDPLYFPRTTLANALLQSLDSGITHAFTLFAPRRMGKTEFLLKDISPMAEKMGYRVFYFSFMDYDSLGVIPFFQSALKDFEKQTITSKAKNTLSAVKSIKAFGFGLDRDTTTQIESISTILNNIAKGKQPVIMLLDEVQELARIKGAEGSVLKSV